MLNKMRVEANPDPPLYDGLGVQMPVEMYNDWLRAYITEEEVRRPNILSSSEADMTFTDVKLYLFCSTDAKGHEIFCRLALLGCPWRNLRSPRAYARPRRLAERREVCYVVHCPDSALI